MVKVNFKDAGGQGYHSVWGKDRKALFEHDDLVSRVRRTFTSQEPGMQYGLKREMFCFSSTLVSPVTDHAIKVALDGHSPAFARSQTRHSSSLFGDFAPPK